jgi:hypothetical protein
MRSDRHQRTAPPCWNLIRHPASVSRLVGADDRWRGGAGERLLRMSFGLMDVEDP